MAKEVQIFDVTVDDVHGNCVSDVMRVYARDEGHAEVLALGEATERHPLNQMGCQKPVLVGRSACWRCGTTQIFDGHVVACPECWD